MRVALLYAALLAFAHLPVVLLGRSQQPSLLYPYNVSGPDGARGRRPVPVFDIDLGTPAYYEAPENRLVGDMWKRGEVPLWNPHQAAGAPLLAQYSSRALFPYQILEDISPAWTWDFFLLGRAWIAGLLTWALLRRILGAAHSALLGGALYMLSGSFTWFLNLEQYANVAMVAPLLLLTLDRLATERRTSNATWVALATALVLLAGQPEVAFYVLAHGGFWTLFRALSTDRAGTPRTLVRYAAASALGIFLAAPLLIPFAEYATSAYHIHPPGGSMGVRSPTPWSLLPGIWLPNLFQQPAHAVDLPLNGRWDYLGGYSGVLPWALIFAALARGRRWRRELAFFAGSAAVVLLKNVAVPPFAWLGHLPLFDQVWTPRWAGPVWVLSLAVAAGIAAESLAPREPDTDARPVNPWVFRVASGALVACVAYAAWAFLRETPELPRDHLFNPLPDRHFASRAAASALVAAVTVGLSLWIALRRSGTPHARLALLVLAVGELTTCIPRGYSYAWLNAGLAPWGLTVCAALALVLDRVRVGLGAGALAAVALAAIDLTSPRGLPPRRDPFAPAPWVSFVRSRVGHQRVTSIGGVLFPNYAGAVGLYDVHYIIALGVSSFREVSMWLLEPSRPPWRRAWGVGMWITGVPEASWAPNGLAPAVANMQQSARFYAMFGVRYVATPRGVRLDRPITPGAEATSPPYRLVYSAEVDVWEHTEVMPRAWLVHDVRRASSTQDAIAQLARGDFDLRSAAVIEGTAPDPARNGGASDPSDSARIVEYGARRVSLEARARRPGLLILSDVYSDGWEAEIDGRAAPIVRVNGCLRGVWMSAGTHRVVYRYQPESFRLGVTIAGVVALLCVFLARPRKVSEGPSLN